MSPYNSWTTDEEFVILQNPLLNARELAELLPNHTYTSIRHKAHELLPKEIQKTKLSRRLFDPTLPTPQLSYVIGVALGDGHVHNRGIILVTKSRDFAKEFAKNISIVLWRVSEYPLSKFKTKYWQVNAYCKAFAQWFKGQANFQVLRLASLYPIDFLHGIVDSEGSVSLWTVKNQIKACVKIYNTNKRLLMFCQNLLQQSQIPSKIYLVRSRGQSVTIRGKKTVATRNCYALQIHTIDGLLKFAEEIGFIQKNKQRKLLKFVHSYVKNKGKA